MDDVPERERTAAAKLLRTLETGDDGAHVDDLLPSFVEAEQAGADVDGDPRFAALLRHLDACVRCATRYAELSAGMAAFVEAAERPEREPAPAAPAFFATPTPAGAVVRALSGIRRSFELTLAGPRLAPSVATLAGEQLLFSGTLSDIPGAPRVLVALAGEQPRATLQVTIRDSERRRWGVALSASGLARSAETDARGVALFTDLAPDALATMTLRCEELGD